MQLIGATERFIRRPFVLKGILQGVLSATIAMILILIIVTTLKRNIPELAVLISTELIIYLFTFILILGILIAGISTSFAVNKYLRMRTGRLYG